MARNPAYLSPSILVEFGGLRRHFQASGHNFSLYGPTLSISSSSYGKLAFLSVVANHLKSGKFHRKVSTT